MKIATRNIACCTESKMMQPCPPFLQQKMQWFFLANQRQSTKINHLLEKDKQKIACDYDFQFQPATNWLHDAFQMDSLCKQMVQRITFGTTFESAWFQSQLRNRLPMQNCASLPVFVHHAASCDLSAQAHQFQQQKSNTRKKSPGQKEEKEKQIKMQMEAMKKDNLFLSQMDGKQGQARKEEQMNCLQCQKSAKAKALRANVEQPLTSKEWLNNGQKWSKTVEKICRLKKALWGHGVEWIFHSLTHWCLQRNATNRHFQACFSLVFVQNMKNVSGWNRNELY